MYVTQLVNAPVCDHSTFFSAHSVWLLSSSCQAMTAHVRPHEYTLCAMLRSPFVVSSLTSDTLLGLLRLWHPYQATPAALCEEASESRPISRISRQAAVAAHRHIPVPSCSHVPTCEASVPLHEDAALLILWLASTPNYLEPSLLNVLQRFTQFHTMKTCPTPKADSVPIEKPCHKSRGTETPWREIVAVCHHRNLKKDMKSEIQVLASHLTIYSFKRNLLIICQIC